MTTQKFRWPWDTMQLNSCTQMCKVSHCVKHRPQPMQMQISFVLTNDMPPFCLLTQWKVFFNAGKLLLHSFINMRSRLHVLTNSEEIIGKFKRKKTTINKYFWEVCIVGQWIRLALLAQECVWMIFWRDQNEWGLKPKWVGAHRASWSRIELSEPFHHWFC